RDPDLQPGQHCRDISGLPNHSARCETLGPAAIEERVSKTVVSLGGQRYRVVIGWGPLRQLGARLRKHLPRKTCAIISDDNVAPLFAKRVQGSLTAAGFEIGRASCRERGELEVRGGHG